MASSSQHTGGLRSYDLRVFRNASTARKTNITLTGGDVYIAAPQTSDMAVLWGESFGSKERKFLRELLHSETICFSLKDTYQIHVRTLWHAHAMTGQNIANGMRRKGNFVLLLHDLVGELTSSWTWAKFIRPLHRVNFSVIAVDLPGFGKSAVAQVCACPRSRWAGQEAHVVAKIMEELSMAKCQILSVGQTCGLLFNVLQSAPHRMCKEQVLVNPVFDRNEIFAHVGIEPPPGAKAGWQEAIKERQQAALIDLLRTTGVRLWCLFDKDRKYRDIETDEKGNVKASRELQREWALAAETKEMLLKCSKDEIVGETITITDITSNDLCEAQCGKRIPVRMFMPSRHLKASISRFLASHENKPWDRMFMPNHIAFGKGLTKSGQKARILGTHEYLDEGRFDASDHSSEPEDAPKGHHQRALAMLEGKSADKTEQARDERYSMELYAEAKEIDHYNKVNEKAEARRLKKEKAKLARSSSDPGMSMQHGHTLHAAAHIAQSRLTQSGATKDQKKLTVTAEAQRDMKTMSWDKCPFEADLSYGVRKMFLDSFANSVETFKVEAEADFKHKARFQHRTGMRTTE